jgi:hypothetical protein
MPCHAMPCHAMPCHAMPCHAMRGELVVSKVDLGECAVDGSRDYKPKRKETSPLYGRGCIEYSSLKFTKAHTFVVRVATCSQNLRCAIKPICCKGFGIPSYVPEMEPIACKTVGFAQQSFCTGYSEALVWVCIYIPDRADRELRCTRLRTGNGIRQDLYGFAKYAFDTTPLCIFGQTCYLCNASCTLLQ